MAAAFLITATPLIAQEIILSLYEIKPFHPAVAELRESLRGRDTRFR